MTRLDSPEVNGKQWNGGALVGYGNAHVVELVPDASSRPPEIDNPQYRGDDPEAVLAGHLGITRWLDLGLRTGFPYSPWLFYAKLQPIGDPYWEAKGGNFAVAITAGVGYTSIRDSGDQSVTFGPGGFDWSSDLTVTTSDFALIFGYRFDEKAIVFGGPFVTKIFSEIEIDHKESDDASSPAALYKISADGQIRGVNLGVQVKISDRKLFVIEAVYSHFEWKDTQSRSSYTGNGGFQFIF